ncbi:hypothetical protein BJY01DRAFT_262394 [Aspergillus pseudoustus]|uniref:Uncharacterized protein n=1 Tax=Aspergillus pseudoustus TaxID=1810923 RepID=A0ABR4IEY3_9EURO
MPNGRIYAYRSHPQIPAPPNGEIIQRERPQPAVHKTPADYGPPGLIDMVLPALPSLKVRGRRGQLWDLLSTGP